jgi:hypothetical protein
MNNAEVVRQMSGYREKNDLRFLLVIQLSWFTEKLLQEADIVDSFMTSMSRY